MHYPPKRGACIGAESATLRRVWTRAPESCFSISMNANGITDDRGKGPVRVERMPPAAGPAGLYRDTSAPRHLRILSRSCQDVTVTGHVTDTFEHAVQCGGQIVAGADSLGSRTGCGTVCALIAQACSAGKPFAPAKGCVMHSATQDVTEE